MPSPSASSRPIHVAILGTGVIAASHIQALRTIPGIEVVGACDLDAAKVEAFQKQWGLPASFQNLEEMLQRAKPDVVHVLLPPHVHAAAAKTCLEGGAHVFVEKPFCLSSEECRSVQAVAERAGRQIGVNHNLTFQPGMLDVLDDIQADRMGAVQHVFISYNIPIPAVFRGPHAAWMFGGPGNLVFELGPHPLSVIYRLLGPVQECAGIAAGKVTLSNGSPYYHTWQVSLTCERGTAQMMLSIGKTFPSTWVHVLGQDAAATVDFWTYTVDRSKPSRFIRTGPLRQGWGRASSLVRQSLKTFQNYSLSALGASKPTWQQSSIRDSAALFYEALAAGKPAPVGVTEGTAVVEACEMIVRVCMPPLELPLEAVHE